MGGGCVWRQREWPEETLRRKKIHPFDGALEAVPDEFRARRVGRIGWLQAGAVACGLVQLRIVTEGRAVGLLLIAKCGRQACCLRGDIRIITQDVLVRGVVNSAGLGAKDVLRNPGGVGIRVVADRENGILQEKGCGWGWVARNGTRLVSSHLVAEPIFADGAHVRSSVASC